MYKRNTKSNWTKVLKDTEAVDGDRTNTAMTSTIDNQIAKPGPVLGGPSSTDKQYTQMTLDNLIDLAKVKLNLVKLYKI